MIAPACYPVNGAEAIVNIKLLQAFSQAGDIAVDLISRNNSYIYPSDEIEKYGVKINEMHLVEFVPHKNFPTLWRLVLLFLNFRLLSLDCVWAVDALRIVKQMTKKNKYDFVLTKNSPSFLLGAFLKKKGFKWVASWNDPFPGSFYPAPYGCGKDNKGTCLERRFIKRMRLADIHVFPTFLLQEHMRSYLKIAESRCRVIPHVVLENTIGRDNGVNNKKNPDILKIIHSGNMYGHRNPHTFFQAIENVLESEADIKISITILGKIDNIFLPEIETLPCLKKCLFVLPPVEYQQSLSLLDSYDVACVLEASCKKGEAVFLPTKVTDFMQKGIPILAISPSDGVLYGMYKNGNIGYFGDVADVKSIEASIRSIYKDFKENKLRYNVIDDNFLSSGVVRSYREIAEALMSC